MGISTGTQRRLKDAGIETPSDLRKNLKGVKAMNGVSDQEVNKLRKVAILSLLSKDVKLNRELAKMDFNSVKDLRKFSVAEWVSGSHGKLNEQQAEGYRDRVSALYSLIKLSAWHLRARQANPGPLYPSPPASEQ
jgi:hypothetical protein